MRDRASSESDVETMLICDIWLGVVEQTASAESLPHAASMSLDAIDYYLALDRAEVERRLRRRLQNERELHEDEDAET